MDELHLQPVFLLPIQGELVQSVKHQIAAAAHGADMDDIAVLQHVRGQRLQEVPQIVAAHSDVGVRDALSERVLFVSAVILHQSALCLCTWAMAKDLRNV